jgi:hypothetical protein
MQNAGTAMLDLNSVNDKPGHISLVSTNRRAYTALRPAPGFRHIGKGDSVLISRPRSGGGGGGMGRRGSMASLKTPVPGSAEALEAQAASGGAGTAEAEEEAARYTAGMEEHEGEVVSTEFDNTGLQAGAYTRPVLSST